MEFAASGAARRPDGPHRHQEGEEGHPGLATTDEEATCRYDTKDKRYDVMAYDLTTLDWDVLAGQ